MCSVASSELDDIVWLAVKSIEDFNEADIMSPPPLPSPTPPPAPPLPAPAPAPVTSRKRSRCQQQQQQQQQQPTKRVRSRPKSPVKNGWTLKPSIDSPIVCWTEEGYHYAVQNPTNSGKYLLKLQLYNAEESKVTTPIHHSGVYLREDIDARLIAEVKELTRKIENLWVNRRTGVPKVTGLSQAMDKIQSSEETQY